MSRRIIELDAIPHLNEKKEVTHYVNGRVTLSPKDTEVEITEVVNADDKSLPIDELPYLLKQKFDQVLIMRAEKIISSPTYDWMDAPDL